MHGAWTGVLNVLAGSLQEEIAAHGTADVTTGTVICGFLHPLLPVSVRMGLWPSGTLLCLAWLCT